MLDILLVYRCGGIPKHLSSQATGEVEADDEATIVVLLWRNFPCACLCRELAKVLLPGRHTGLEDQRVKSLGMYLF